MSRREFIALVAGGGTVRGARAERHTSMTTCDVVPNSS